MRTDVVHLFREPSRISTACGLPAHPRRATIEYLDVSCGNCLRSKVWVEQADRLVEILIRAFGRKRLAELVEIES